MIILAHDGSVYGDWVARYAIRFAISESDRKLLVLNVKDGQMSPELVEARFSQLAEECDSQNVEFLSQSLPLGKSVHRSLRQALPHDPDALLICGTRIKPRKQALLTGTVSEQLLRSHQSPVLALRVVQPGLLGNPHDLLLPLAGHDAGFSKVWPVFRRLAPNLNTVHMFRALQVHDLYRSYLSSSREAVLRRIGNAHLDAVCAELNNRLTDRHFRIDRRVMISTDWVNEVLVQASRLKAQILLLGVSERSLAHRVFHGVGLERILRNSPCDVGIYRGP
jgi:nucleotide-binding universal stress UspA family protein